MWNSNTHPVRCGPFHEWLLTWLAFCQTQPVQIYLAWPGLNDFTERRDEWSGRIWNRLKAASAHTGGVSGELWLHKLCAPDLTSNGTSWCGVSGEVPGGGADVLVRILRGPGSQVGTVSAEQQPTACCFSPMNLTRGSISWKSVHFTAPRPDRYLLHSCRQLKWEQTRLPVFIACGSVSFIFWSCFNFPRIAICTSPRYLGNAYRRNCSTLFYSLGIT